MKILSLYDEKCSLCQTSKKSFMKLDWLHKVRWVSLQGYEKDEQSLLLNRSDLRKELHIILPSGRLLKGFYAIRRLLLCFPITFLIGVFLYLPFMPIIGNPVYKWIAKNRYKWLRKNCKGDSCSL